MKNGRNAAAHLEQARIAPISARAVLSLLLGLLPLWFGCAATKGQSIFDPSGRCLFNPDYKCPLSGKRDKEAKPLPASKEPKQSDGAPSACETSPWSSTDTSTPVFRGKESDRWVAQLPNGGVLFPKYFNANGPKVVMEPRTMIAQVGTEVVMVASYVGEGNQYLRTGQKLEWNLDGTGHFLTSNPSNGCFDASTTKRLSPKQMLTSTSSKLWRIHRGTATPTDDITILRGQSWATVQSAEEGTTSVSVYAPNIDDWGNRTASGQIHWIDAMFRFPSSRVSPVGQTIDLTTLVFRKTVPQPRSGWIVRYQILSGPSAGFGPNDESVIEVPTDENGQATVPLTQTSGAPGCNNIKIQIIRPAGDGMERAVVDEKTITQVWSGNALFTLGFKGPSAGTPGKRLSYEMEVTNRSQLPQDAVVRATIPPGTRIAASNPQVSGYEGNTAVWELDGLPAGSRQLIAFDLDVDTNGILSFNARVDQKGATYTTPSDPAPGSSSEEPLGDSEDYSGINIPDQPPQSADSTPPAPSKTEPASVPPALDGSSAPEGGNVVIEADMFPTEMTSGKEFNGRVRVTKNGDAPDVALSILLPEGVYFLEKDPNGGTPKRYTGTPTPIVFNDFQFGEDYALYFSADRLGEKEIRIRVVDKATNEVIARKEVTVRIVP